MSTPPSSQFAATRRLDQADSWLVEFEAQVLGTSAYAGKPSIVLDRSAFYPEAGGQLGDRGTINGHRVIDVQIDNDGVVHHLVESLPSLAPASFIEGVIDGYRRRVHMAQHTGQHMLSRALLDIAGAETVSSRLGESICTIDAGVESMSERQIADAEALVNQVIDQDVAVRAYVPDADELAILPLRRPPKVEDNIRVIAIGGYDVSPCGGTHCTRTGQVGLVRVISTERYKGMTRVNFVAGDRGRRVVFESDAVVREVAREYSCAPAELAEVLEKSRRDQAGLRAELREVTGLLARSAAASLIDRAGGEIVIGLVPGANLELMRAIAAVITESPRSVALLATETPDGVNVLAARGAGADFDCGALIKAAAAATGGRGGGRPDRAEGRLPRGIDWSATTAGLVAAAQR